MDVMEKAQNGPDGTTAGTTCPKEPKSCPADSGQNPRVRSVGELTECLEPNAAECPYSLSFGLGYFCKRPKNHRHDANKN